MARLTLADRVVALRSAIDATRGRIAPEVVEAASAVLARAEERAQLSAEHTVVALAGATGAGKSTIFNLLAGADVARTGRQRPTTAFPLAAVAETAELRPGSAALLDWLGVSERHELPVSARHPRGLLLLDLPDHDSVVTEHRLRADHVTERADLLIWVTNPQKYADGVLHDRYLAPLTGRDDAVAVVLNQLDRLDAAAGRQVVDDLTRLVRADGLSARVIGASASTGQGIDELRELIVRAVARRESATARMTADVRAAAATLLDALPAAHDARGEQAQARRRLLAALDDAAGIPLVVDAVQRSSVRDAIVRTGWPPSRWVRRLRADPLRVLGLRGDAKRGQDPSAGEVVRTSLPPASPAVRAQLSTAARDYVAGVSPSLPARAGEELSARAVAATADVGDALDVAVARTVRLRPARWWCVVDALQWLLLVAAVAGGVWLGGLAVLDYLRVPTEGLVPAIDVGVLELPWPTVLLGGGVLAGLVLAGLGRVFGGVGARRRAARVGRELRASVQQVADDRILGAVDAELATISAARAAAERAAQPR
ncbi:GTPase [Microbacterium sp. No. 7]|uniref:GTPase n=1 Tax=Microbacterium sp. No. 7 TaxID=1714373 RepID=UPI0006D19CA7|nr:GTPase [Microbacterium sp. No. 7]ALJ20499.1 hypothetical protein AOA12_11525 [Microbacterium sp. No. 7]